MRNEQMIKFMTAGLLMAAAVALSQQLGAQELDENEWCRIEGSKPSACEVRTFSLASSGELEIDAEPNGSITVEAWDRAETVVYARVAARGDTQSEADEMISRVQIEISGSSVESSGPRSRGNRSWWVSYRAFVPRSTDLSLESTNGGITVTGVSGEIEAETVNGGISLDGLAGRVRARTTNGSVRIDLEGDTWHGEGVEATTTNGSVRISVPAVYHAVIETGTVNGSFTSEMPVTIQGRLNRRNVSVTLGDGGPTIKARTTNGSVKLLDS